MVFAITFLAVFISGFVFWAIGTAIEDNAARCKKEIREIKKAQEANKAYTFQRHNCVEGTLRAEGNTYRTFNSGTLTLDNVTIHIFSGIGCCQVEDITIGDFSAWELTPRGLSGNEQTNYMLELLNQATKHGNVKQDVKNHITKIVRDIRLFDELKRKGWISSKAGNADYIWTK